MARLQPCRHSRVRLGRPVFSTIVFVVGGLPFLQMAWSELRARKPGMMALISLAITVAFVFSMATVFVLEGEAFFRETGDADRRHAARALDRKAQCAPGIGRARQAGTVLPDKAERLGEDGKTEEVPVSELREGDLVLRAPRCQYSGRWLHQRGESEVD